MTAQPATPTPAPGGVSLEEYVYAVSRVAGGPAGGPWREWVLVDEDELVLAVFSSRESAVDELNARFDMQPSLVERLRLVAHCNAYKPFDEWPRGGSVAERAGALARHLSNTDEPSDDAVAECVRAHFLRGEAGWAHIGGERRRSVELWWYARGGEHEPVGLVIERAEEGAWQLLLDGRSRGLTERQLHRRIARVMRRLGDDRWSETEVASVGCDDVFGRSADELYGPAALYVRAQLMLADELHVAEPLGQAWP